MRESEAAEKSESQVGRPPELKSGNAVEQTERQTGGGIRQQAPADCRWNPAVPSGSGLTSITISIVEPDDRVILQVMHDGYCGYRRLPGEPCECQPMQRNDGRQQQV